MPDYSREVWVQLRKLTKRKFINALEKDGWVREQKGKRGDGKKGAGTLAYRHNDRPQQHNRIVVHYHNDKDIMGEGLLKGQLLIVGWTEQDLKRLKLIK